MRSFAFPQSMFRLTCSNIFFVALSFFSSGIADSAIAQSVNAEVRLLDKPEGSPVGPVLTAETSVKLLARKGFWVKVEAKGTSGWVKASYLSFSGSKGGATAIDTGRLGTGNIVSASAARGLSAKDLLNGDPNPQEVDKCWRRLNFDPPPTHG